jgi:hypothetical protein
MMSGAHRKSITWDVSVTDFSSDTDREMWNFLVYRTRHGVKCVCRQHSGRAAGVGESAARLRPVGPTAGASAYAALRRRRRDARSRCARVRHTHLRTLQPRFFVDETLPKHPCEGRSRMFWISAGGRSSGDEVIGTGVLAIYRSDCGEWYYFKYLPSFDFF